jgi:hypothetical protein
LLKRDYVASVALFAMVDEPGTITRDEKIRILVLVKRTVATPAQFWSARQIVIAPQPGDRHALFDLRTDPACNAIFYAII